MSRRPGYTPNTRLDANTLPPALPLGRADVPTRVLMFPTALMLRYTHCPRTGRRGDGANNSAAGTEPIIILLYCVAACGIAPLCGMRGICLLPAGALRLAGAVLRVCCRRIRLSLCFRRFDYGVERHSKAFVSTSDSRRFLSPPPPNRRDRMRKPLGFRTLLSLQAAAQAASWGGADFCLVSDEKNMRFFCLNSKFIIFAYVKL